MKAKKLLAMCLAMAFVATSASALGACSLLDAFSTGDDGSAATSTSGELASDNGNSSTPNSSTAEEKKDVTVRFLVDGEVYAEVTGKEGSRITLPKTNPTQEHMSFVKWDGYTNGERYSESKDFVAVFQDMIYTVKFTDGGATVKEFSGKYGETFEAPVDPAARNSYTFLGWEGFDPTDLVIDGNAEYKAKWEYSGIAYAAAGTFDATSLEKDAIFATSNDITTFALVQNNENAAAKDKAYTVSLVHDDTYLYVYIFSLDAAQDDDDRLSFYIVKSGETATSNIQTYPNKTDPYSTNKELCEAINAGKVNGGYALKAKIALSSLEVTDNAIGFGIRFIDMNNKVVYLSEGSVPDDTSNTKTGQAEHLPVLKLNAAEAAE